MQSRYPARFDREMGCTEADLLNWLPGASGGRAVEPAPGGACVRIGSGLLRLRWRTLPPRRIALLSLPVLAVSFEFDAVPEVERQAFMRYFDLHTQRGGG